MADVKRCDACGKIIEVECCHKIRLYDDNKQPSTFWNNQVDVCGECYNKVKNILNISEVNTK